MLPFICDFSQHNFIKDTICKKYSKLHQFSEMSFNPSIFTLFFFEVPVFPPLPHLIGGLISLNGYLSVGLPEQFRQSLLFSDIRFIFVVCDVTL